jgi:probable serine/threonine-protein kinase DDB_G0283337
MKKNGKGFKVEETKSPFEYLKPSFHKITLNDKNKKDNNKSIINNNDENSINDTNNYSNNEEKADENPIKKSKIDQIIEEYRKKYSIKSDNSLNSNNVNDNGHNNLNKDIHDNLFEEKEEIITIEETEDLFRK